MHISHSLASHALTKTKIDAFSSSLHRDIDKIAIGFNNSSFKTSFERNGRLFPSGSNRIKPWYTGICRRNIMHKGDINCPPAPDVFVAELLMVCRQFKIATMYSLALLQHSGNNTAHTLYILYFRWLLTKR